MKAYKGFDKNLKCRGFQYEVGKTYETDEAKLCESGFHACEAPLDVFNYYPPSDGRYCEAELEDVSEERSGDSKRVGKKITIGAEIGVPGLVKAHVEWVKENIDHSLKQMVIPGNRSSASNTGNRSSASNTGYLSSASNTGNRSSASNTGDFSSASNTGDFSSASNTGDSSSASNTGDFSSASNTGDASSASNTGYASSASNTGDASSASNTGDRSSASNTGDSSSASNTGDFSSASNTGDASSASNTGNRSSASNTGNRSSASNTGDRSSASVSGKGSVALCVGRGSKAKASKGSAIVVCERGEWNGEDYPLLAIKAAIVDGETIKADTWYTLENGEFVEVSDDEE